MFPGRPPGNATRRHSRPASESISPDGLRAHLARWTDSDAGSLPLRPSVRRGGGRAARGTGQTWRGTNWPMPRAGRLRGARHRAGRRGRGGGGGAAGGEGRVAVPAVARLPRGPKVAGGRRPAGGGGGGGRGAAGVSLDPPEVDGLGEDVRVGGGLLAVAAVGRLRDGADVGLDARHVLPRRWLPRRPLRARARVGGSASPRLLRSSGAPRITNRGSVALHSAATCCGP